MKAKNSTKVSTNNAVLFGQLLEFDVAFPKENPLTIDEYLIGGSKSTILNAAMVFLGFKGSQFKFKSNSELLTSIFREANEDFAKEIHTNILEAEKSGDPITVFNTYSSLRLFEYFLLKPEEPQTQTNEEFERNLFKAYLVLNSDYTKKQSVAFSSCEGIDQELIIPMMVFCMEYPTLDKSNYNINQIWATQTIKAIYLFQFLESNIKTQPLLKAFLASFNTPTWQDYLKSLLPLTMTALKNEDVGYTDIIITKDEKFNENFAFLEKLIIQDKDELDKDEFLTVRAKPFYKISDGVYRIVFNLFVVEKIFKGVYFLLRDVNKNLLEKDKIKNIRSFYGNEFSEKILCYKVIESIYPNKCISFSGEKLSNLKIDGAPDYYIRKDKNIILFESKDFLITAEKKASFDFHIYNEEFEKVLYYQTLSNNKEKHKAVMQLIKNIRKLLKNEFIPDQNYYYKDVIIYPVLLTHDHQYNTPGFNELIDYWFQGELLELKKEGLFVHHVKPISVVCIDTLIYNQIGLTKDIPLHEMLKLYHSYKNIPQKKEVIKNREQYEIFMENYKQSCLSKLLPFSLFIENYFYKNGLSKIPPILDSIGPALFKEEFAAREATKNKL